jgi:hypothetical protein
MATRAAALKRAPVLIATYFCAGFGYAISATFIVTILEKLPLLARKDG